MRRYRIFPTLLMLLAMFTLLVGHSLHILVHTQKSAHTCCISHSENNNNAEDHNENPSDDCKDCLICNFNLSPAAISNQIIVEQPQKSYVLIATSYLERVYRIVHIHSTSRGPPSNI